MESIDWYATQKILISKKTQEHVDNIWLRCLDGVIKDEKLRWPACDNSKVLEVDTIECNVLELR